MQVGRTTLLPQDEYELALLVQEFNWHLHSAQTIRQGNLSPSLLLKVITSTPPVQTQNKLLRIKLMAVGTELKVWEFRTGQDSYTAAFDNKKSLSTLNFHIGSDSSQGLQLVLIHAT